MRASPAVLSAEDLLDQVWDENADPFTNTVHVTISRLRRKLGDPTAIETTARRRLPHHRLTRIGATNNPPFGTAGPHVLPPAPCGAGFSRRRSGQNSVSLGAQDRMICARMRCHGHLRCRANSRQESVADRCTFQQAQRNRSRGVSHGARVRSLRVDAVAGLAHERVPKRQKPWRSPSRPSDWITSPSATASGAPNRLLRPDPVRHMSVINRPVERGAVNCDGLCRRLERAVDASLMELTHRSARYKRTQPRWAREPQCGCESSAHS